MFQGYVGDFLERYHSIFDGILEIAFHIFPPHLRLKKSEPLKRSRTGPAFLHRKGTAAYNEADGPTPDGA